ncbi:Canalicular multispecific organic anion transporter 2 [Folsomia candida]|uniref:Canalicular multispecific organic anion transporter 2 n=1 Tax=Folsomia candida TaxID=158441 RepID=A0A226DAL7_FOLCA|nr:Canalicular multispecific organic anion transporter 2 [Folsomia candida]
MGADSQKICDLIPLLHTIWIAPLQTIVATYLLYNLLGYSAFGALSAILILILLTALLMKQLKDLQTNQMTAKDFRVNLVSEAIKNLKTIKLHAWNDVFLKRIEIARKLENWNWNPVPALAMLVSQTSISIRRINKFLNLVDFELHKSYIKSDKIINVQASIRFENVYLSWDNKKSVLSNLHFSIPPGSLVTIGKSSFLQAILGNLIITKGRICVNGKIAYASESSWIKRATIQENILLHNQMDKHLYLDVLSACELDTDLSCMPMRDDTLIIDNGANLSGGQRQRISLARAAYNEVTPSYNAANLRHSDSLSKAEQNTTDPTIKKSQYLHEGGVGHIMTGLSLIIFSVATFTFSNVWLSIWSGQDDSTQISSATYNLTIYGGSGLPKAPLVIIYYFLQRFYVLTSTNLRRNESLTRTPLYSPVLETLSGLCSIKALGIEKETMEEIQKYLLENNKAWIKARLDILGTIIVLGTYIFVVISKDHLSPAVIALSLSSALQITQLLNYFAKLTKISNKMVTQGQTTPSATWQQGCASTAVWSRRLRGGKFQRCGICGGQFDSGSTLGYLDSSGNWHDYTHRCNGGA